jgi:hypothetical protein
LSVERNDDFATASLCSPGVVALVKQMMLKSVQEKGPKRSSLAAHLGKIISPEEPREEFLGQVCGVFGRIDPTPHMSVNRVPVRLAEVFEGLSGGR